MSKPTNNEQSILTESHFLGLVDYEKAYDIQRNLWVFAKCKQQNSIIGLEHPAVITLGRRCDQNEHVSLNTQIPVIKSTRGGLATIHSEGQLVIYPIMDVRSFKVGVKNFVKRLLITTQKTFAQYGIETTFDEKNVGLYTKNGKIAFCGLEIKEGVSQHGLSINISNELNLFKSIVACGVSGQNLDRVSNYRTDVTTRDFYQSWVENFKIEKLNQ